MADRGFIAAMINESDCMSGEVYVNAVSCDEYYIQYWNVRTKPCVLSTAELTSVLEYKRDRKIQLAEREDGENTWDYYSDDIAELTTLIDLLEVV